MICEVGCKTLPWYSDRLNLVMLSKGDLRDLCRLSLTGQRSPVEVWASSWTRRLGSYSFEHDWDMTQQTGLTHSWGTNRSTGRYELTSRRFFKNSLGKESVLPISAGDALPGNLKSRIDESYAEVIMDEVDVLLHPLKSESWIEEN